MVEPVQHQILALVPLVGLVPFVTLVQRATLVALVTLVKKLFKIHHLLIDFRCSYL